MSDEKVSGLALDASPARATTKPKKVLTPLFIQAKK